MIKFYLLIALCFLSCTVRAADLLAKNDRVGCFTALLLSGTIKKGDADKFQKNLSRFKAERSCDSGFSIGLNSDGGDVDEALKIGRVIRENQLETGGHDWEERCYSACVFILAAGVKRYSILVEVGIHRPYFVDLDEGLTLENIKAMREKRIQSLREYLAYVDVPISLLELMLSIEPGNIKILTLEEKKEFRLYGTDPSYEEKRNAISASLYNMTSSEYRFRNSKAFADCKRTLKNEDDMSTCITSKMLGISMQEAKRRWKLHEQICLPKSIERERLTCIKNYVINGKL